MSAPHALLPVPFALPFALALVLLSTGCEERPKNQVIEPAASPSPTELDHQSTEKDIAQLAFGKDVRDAASSKKYDDARDHLIRRGSAIESELIDALRRNDDWGVRLGLVEVLQATGTRACVPHLIAVLDDPEPLVAYLANKTLEEMTKHAEIPASGAPGTNGLPPVAKRPASDLALDAEQNLWSTWQKVYGPNLRGAWDRWWATNKDQIGIH